jgi:hypothetical protein
MQIYMSEKNRFNLTGKEHIVLPYYGKFSKNCLSKFSQDRIYYKKYKPKINSFEIFLRIPEGDFLFIFKMMREVSLVIKMTQLIFLGIFVC